MWLLVMLKWEEKVWSEGSLGFYEEEFLFFSVGIIVKEYVEELNCCI